MCGFLEKLIGGGGGDTPTVVRESPLADQAKIDSEAAAAGAAEKTARKRRMRASSLLATGGMGDASAPSTATPGAAPGTKTTLGA